MKFFYRILFLCWFSVATFALCTVYFTPRDDLKAQLIQLIKEERVSIDCAVYMFTEKTIAQAMIDAYLRGVKIRIIVDQISMGEKYGKGLFLRNNGLDVVVYMAPSFNPYFAPIMHHKFFIFGRNVRLQQSLVWTGSYNCTASASRLHEENAIMTDDLSVVVQYRECFKMLLHRIQPGRSALDNDESDQSLMPHG